MFRVYRMTRGAFSGWMLVAGLVLAGGCHPRDDVARAREDLRQGQEYLRRSQALFEAGVARDAGSQESLLGLGDVLYAQGKFSEAAAQYARVETEASFKKQGMARYHAGDFSAATEAFGRIARRDDQANYYFGLSCEKLNLFEKALAAYAQIDGGEFGPQARARQHAIERQRSAVRIETLDPFAAKLIASAPADAKYPQAGALILWCDESMELTRDNRLITTTHYLVKVLNDRGKQDFSEAQLEYDSTDEKVTLEFARTIKPDGTVAEVGERHIRDVSKYLNFPLYSNARVRIISFPEVAQGSVLEYKAVTERRQLVNGKDVSLAYPLRSREPVLDARFSLTVPRGRELKFSYLNRELADAGMMMEPLVEETAQTKVYRWKYLDIPQIVPEPHMPPLAEVNPTVIFSSFRDWQELYAWWWPLAKDKVRADADISAKVSALTAGKPTPEEKARALYEFCAQHIRYVAVEYGDAGYEPHEASLVFRNKYGDCKDQAVLLAAMLQEAGLEAALVLIPTREMPQMREAFPSMLFNHCIAAVRLEGNWVYLDPTAETCAFGDLPEGDQDRTVLVCTGKGYSIGRTPLYEAPHNLLEHLTDISILPEGGIEASRKVFTRGGVAQGQRYWLRYSQPEKITHTLEEKVQGMTVGGALEGYEVLGAETLVEPVELRYRFKGPEYLLRAGKLRIVPELVDMDLNLVAAETRRFPLDLGTPLVQRSQVTLSLPSGMRVEYLPEGVREDTPWYSCAVSCRAEGAKIVCEQELRYKVRQISVTDYPKFKQSYEETARRIKPRIVLEKTDG